MIVTPGWRTGLLCRLMRMPIFQPIVRALARQERSLIAARQFSLYAVCKRAATADKKAKAASDDQAVDCRPQMDRMICHCGDASLRMDMNDFTLGA